MTNNCTNFRQNAVITVVKVFVLLMSINQLVVFTTAQRMGSGPCPKLQPVKNFNTTAYAGVWHEVEKFWFLFEATASCVRVEYFDEKNEDGSFGVQINMFDNMLRTAMTNRGLTKFISKDGSADLILDLEISQLPFPFTVRYPYLVLGTDYKTYTIKWACMNTGPMHLQSLWILSRTKTLPAKSRKEVYNTLKTLGISTQNIRKSNTQTCSVEDIGRV